MTDRSVEELRSELRNLGYLSHGLERWFARDPWKSGTFWTELLLVSSKASIVIALFATVTTIAIMVVKNDGLPLVETMTIASIYLATAFIAAMVIHLVVALVLKSNPAFGIEKPRALMIISMALSGFLSLSVIAWWTAFPSEPGIPELIVFAALLILFFSTSSIVISAALLSFSIHETRSIPRIHRKPRTIPLIIGALLLFAMTFALSLTDPTAKPQPEASQVVVRPTDARVALIAVDGLTMDLFGLRSELAEKFAMIGTTEPERSSSTVEAWASIGTGTPPSIHEVRSIEGIRFFGRQRVIQHVSQLDHGVRAIAPALGLAERQPLPPSARNRDYVWEILAERGITTVAVNWWATKDDPSPPSWTTSQETIFSMASSRENSPLEVAVAIDRLAIEELLDSMDRHDPRFATVYLPALDVILNRIEISEQARLAGTLRVLEQLESLVESLSERQWSLILVGRPGNPEGKGMIAATNHELVDADLVDVAPTILALYGFPPSVEMRGEPLVPAAPPILSYGSRESDRESKVSDEYYENLKSLGYIR